MKRSLLLSTCLFSSLLAHSAHAQDKPYIVVSPTRSEMPINQVASSVTVIDSQQIARENKSTVTELLRNVPGLTVANNGGTGQPTRLFMRGTNSNHVLVLLDGVALNDPSDPATALDFSNLTTDNIERIEVLRGPQSTIYGSQAIGGVISIFTKQGKGKPTTTAQAEYGRYNSSKLLLGNSGQIGKTSYSVTAGKTGTSGFSSLSKRMGGFEKDSNDSYTLAANVISQLTDNFTAKLTGRYNRTDTEFDSPGSFIRPADDYAPNNDSRQLSGRVAGELKLLDGRWTQEFSASSLNLNRQQITVFYDSFGSEYFGRQQYIGWRDKFDWIHHFKLNDSNMLTGGVEKSTDHYKTNTQGEIEVWNTAAFIDDQINITKELYLNAGARIDNHETFGKQFTWKFAPGYNIESTGTRLKATYGTGFKAPSLSQLYDPSSGNPNVNPEKSKGWDMGFEQSVWDKKASFGATFFRNDIINLIGNDTSPPYASINTGKARTEGVESVVQINPLPELHLEASHVYTLSQDRARDKELARRPRHQANFKTTYDYSDEGDVGMNVRYESSRRDFDVVSFANTYAKSFTTIDLDTNYRYSPNATLYGRIENLLDKEYEEVSGYAQPGLGIYGGIKLSY